MNHYFANIITPLLKLKFTKIDCKANLDRIINNFQNRENVQRIKVTLMQI